MNKTILDDHVVEQIIKKSPLDIDNSLILLEGVHKLFPNDKYKILEVNSYILGKKKNNNWYIINHGTMFNTEIIVVKEFNVVVVKHYEFPNDHPTYSYYNDISNACESIKWWNEDDFVFNKYGIRVSNDVILEEND